MKRTQIAPGVHLSYDAAQKFNRCRISIHFAFPARRETATAHAPVYLLLPYMAALVLALYAVVLLVRLTRGGARVRAYIHEQTAQKLPSLCRATAVLCAAASAGQGVAVFAADAQMLWGMQGVFILFELLSCAAFAAAALFLKRMPWEKEE